MFYFTKSRFLHSEAHHTLLPLITEARAEAGRCDSSASFTSGHKKKKKGPITFGYSPLSYSMHMQKPKPNAGKRKNDGRLFENVLNKFKIS